MAPKVRAAAQESTSLGPEVAEGQLVFVSVGWDGGVQWKGGGIFVEGKGRKWKEMRASSITKICAYRTDD